MMIRKSLLKAEASVLLIRVETVSDALSDIRYRLSLPTTARTDADEREARAAFVIEVAALRRDRMELALVSVERSRPHSRVRMAGAA